MNRHEFRTMAESRAILLDGATGTELFKRGLPPGAAPEDWVLDNPRVLQQLQREYFAAGSDIVLACAFGANRLKLADQGLSERVGEMNRELAAISREIVPPGGFLFGDVSPTGQLVEPFGQLGFEEAVAVYREQARGLVGGGVDGFLIETMMDIQEARAALIGVREAAPDLPIFVTMTYDHSGRTIGGTTPEAALVTLQALGADAVGCNCSTGPEEMLVFLEKMAPYARVPLVVKPNAGMPCMCGGREEYAMEPGVFAEALAKAVGMGARVVGGCCGTTPAHIKAVKTCLERPGVAPPLLRSTRAALSSARRIVDFSDIDGLRPPLAVIGERINPTGKKKFQAELMASNLGSVLAFAEQQAEAGASLLDVNLGLGGIDEPSMLRQAVAMLSANSVLPLVIDTVNPDAMERALRLYPGRALVNSVSGEKNRLEQILPVAAKYGAMIIVLPVGEGFIPATAGERLEVAGGIILEAQKQGLAREDVIVDGLAMTVSAEPSAGLAALEFIGLCSEAGLRSLIGLSNVSFGMPDRKWLNSVFLAMGMARGLSAVIANPSAELLLEVKTTAEALLCRHNGAAAYIERFAKPAEGEKPVAAAGKTGQSSTPGAEAATAVLRGDIKRSAELARAAIASGVGVGVLLSDHLVPAIMAAGGKFERGVYFLPQLMLAGQAMRLALDEIEPELALERLAGGDAVARGRILMATVEGDVHDIGKNLVTLMLRNHGYEVLDLGKDVSAGKIIEEAERFKPDIIGLSALMTTTLAAMRRTVEAVRGAGMKVKIMAGGAAVTEHFALEAGADGYAADAVTAVRLAGDLLAGGE